MFGFFDPFDNSSYRRRASPPSYYSRDVSPFDFFNNYNDYDYEDTIRRRELERRQREKELQEQRKRDAEILAQKRQYEAELKRRQMEAEIKRQEAIRRQQQEEEERKRKEYEIQEQLIKPKKSRKISITDDSVPINTKQPKQPKTFINETIIISEPSDHKVKVEKNPDADYIILNIKENCIDKSSVRIDVDGQRKLILRARAGIKENEDSSSLSEDEEFDQCEATKNHAFGEVKPEGSIIPKKSVSKCLYWNFTLPSSLVDRSDISAKFSDDELIIEIPKIANPEKDVMRIIINQDNSQ